jgi:hypothetical protein
MSIFRWFKPRNESVTRFSEVENHFLGQTPGIYWYPYSGFDLTPVVLDLPRNKMGVNILSAESDGIPLVLSDADESFGTAVSQGYVNISETEHRYAKPYQELHRRLQHKAEPLPESRIFGEFVFSSLTGREHRFPALIFQVRVTSDAKVAEACKHNPKNPRWVVAIHASTGELLDAFVESQIRVETLAIVKVGGFAQIPWEAKVRDVFPKMFASPENSVFPKYLLTDGSFFTHFCLERDLKAEFVDTGLHMKSWGYQTVRLYKTRPKESTKGRSK